MAEQKRRKKVRVKTAPAKRLHYRRVVDGDGVITEVVTILDDSGGAWEMSRSPAPKRQGESHGR